VAELELEQLLEKLLGLTDPIPYFNFSRNFLLFEKTFLYLG
jgi:hypothetical protein